MKNGSKYLFLIALALSAALISSACAGSGLRLDRHIYYSNPQYRADFEIKYNQFDSEEAEMVSQAAREALPKITQWGDFKDKLLIRIHPTHGDLEQQINRHGYPWLRGWARYESIDLQSPRTWGGDCLKMRIERMMVHEMTHVIMYQNGGRRHNWYRKDFPLWFREGMASVTAEQADMRGPREDIRKYYIRGALDGDPISDADTMVKEHPKIVYLVAHWAFTDLLNEFGREKIVSIISKVGDGQRFGIAWRSTLGIPLKEWQDKWRDNYSNPASS